MGAVTDKVKSSFETIHSMNNELIGLSKTGIESRLGAIRNVANTEHVLVMVCAYATAEGVQLAIANAPPLNVLLVFLLAAFTILLQHFTGKRMEQVRAWTMEAVDRHAAYYEDRSLSNMRMYAGCGISMFQDPNRVLFVAADGTRYLAKEMLEHIVNMTPVGRDYLTTVVAIGSVQDGEYNCVDYNFFETASAEDSTPAPTPVPGPNSLPN